MGMTELFILALGLAMDAFAVSVCKGLSMEKIGTKQMCTAGVWFGGFQAFMPLLGYYLGHLLAWTITKYDHWIAFILLAVIGGNMIKESRGAEEEFGSGTGAESMFLLAVATSIDAFAVGVTFAFLDVDIVSAVIVIGIITFLCSAAGVKLGSIFGKKYKTKAECFGGAVLILLGLKILLEGMGIL